MPRFLGITTAFVQMVPTAANEVPSGALYKDNATDVVTVPGSSGQNYLVKSMIGAQAFPAGTPIAKQSNGRAAPADSDGTGGGQNFVGFALTACSGIDSSFSSLLPGPNLAGALAGLGFTPGEEVYLDETSGGYVDSVAAFTGNNDSIIKLGVADCSEGIASSTATDLIAFASVIARP